jgi:hypothetical protein
MQSGCVLNPWALATREQMLHRCTPLYANKAFVVVQIAQSCQTSELFVRTRRRRDRQVSTVKVARGIADGRKYTTRRSALHGIPVRNDRQ